jgi:hypothetical protein
VFSKRWNWLNQFGEEYWGCKNRLNIITIVLDTKLTIGKPKRNLYDLEGLTGIDIYIKY